MLTNPKLCVQKQYNHWALTMLVQPEARESCSVVLFLFLCTMSLYVTSIEYLITLNGREQIRQGHIKTKFTFIYVKCVHLQEAEEVGFIKENTCRKRERGVCA